jgi:hypothetical protein
MTNDELDIKETTFVYDNTTYQGHYYVEGDIVHVTSALGSKEEQLKNRDAKAVATVLLKDIVKAAKRLV